ncbi:gliding motility-associated C-terminal domain-containing protein [Polaribacter sp. KT25b]|uniref:T9SS type B sorting domain-containing protein n=1 Tax=Polaribacter sp. KT25b TaxID=1855336 RepID=UPI00087DC4E1|nr:T9SS type B sorting domain-containing protein [Polaribacter sp. KT25b]SDR82791.1 gliding motility-associated C-terminal domain-containing protein [Polaribacter sp. KT25b]
MRKILLFLPLIFTLNIFSQKEANFWYFGANAALDFNSGQPVPVDGSLLNTVEGCSSFSNADGELLFYVGAPSPTTNNLTIWNRNNEPMQNGVSIQGDASSSQAALTIPAPGNPNLYYLFVVGAASSGNQGFWYYTIDMTKNNNLGDVVSGPRDLSDGLIDFWSEKVTAVRGKNCNEYWVISLVSNTFYSYKVNSSGVDYNNPIKSNISNFFNNDSRGYLKVSPNGTKIVAANMSAGSFLLDFNDETGIVSNIKKLNVDGDGYGVEFSRNSERVYISTGQVSNSIENLFQFDLTQPSIDAINDSRYLVHSYNNARGALQLGPDGKIYWTSNGSERINVIKNPNELGANCDYSHRSVLITTPGSGVTASQGLPPFISSLLLPVKVTETSSGNSINDEILQLCTGQNKEITSEKIVGSEITYEWSFIKDTNSTIISTEPNLQLTNINLEDTGNYTLTVKLKDECDNFTQYTASFQIEVFESLTANKPNDINFCDSDNDGFNEFDLETTINSQVLNGQNALISNISYYNSFENAIDLVNPITLPYKNPTAFSKETIYVRIHNNQAINTCFEITNFELNVYGEPIIQDPTEYRVCDNTSIGTDTDGIVNDFILSNKNSEILGSLDPTKYSISYHTTLNGAQTSSLIDVIDKTTNYTNIKANSQPIFVRVENNSSSTCFNASKSFNLEISPLPIINSKVELKQCDNDTDGFSNFNLYQAATSISTDYQNESFTFYPTLADANAGSNAYSIDETTTFRNRTQNTDTVWARAKTSFGCYRISEVLLTVSTTGIPETFQYSFTECDDFLDSDGNYTISNSDTDGITNFDFSSVNEEVIKLFPIGQQITITYYRNESDALAEKDPIINTSKYRNIGYSTTQKIFIRVDSDLNNDCLGLGPHITLNVDTVPKANSVQNLEECDNIKDGSTSNGIVQNFNLESQTATILGTQNPADFTVTYHDSAANANSGNDPLSSPFTNSVRDLQTIYVRVTNNSTSCFTDHITFNLIVNPLPIANFVDDLNVCDNDIDNSARNGFSSSIDLESQTSGILGTQDPKIYSVTYHNSLAEAQNGNSPLVSPYTNLTPYRETIYVRVYNADAQCANGISNFDVIVNPEPTFETISNLSECDNNDDFDDANNIIQTIDLDGKIPEILGASQDPDDFNVTFHSSKANATSGNLPISSPYENSSATETIYVRIQNKKTGCINDDAFFDVIVNPLPDFTVTTPQILCLNNLPLNIFVENQKGTYEYVWKYQNGDTVSTEDNVNISVAGTYTVTATTTNGTFCSRTETIVINESNIATLENSFITIIDESNNIGSESNLSIAINTIDNDLGPGDYQFAIENTDENTRIPFAGFQDDPLFENLEGGIYKIIVNDKNGCSPDTTLLVSVIQFPKFFTPNADGDNDTWIVRGVNKTFYPTSSINIFNRFGKLVAQLPIDSQSWDGTYGGKTLSSDDYWFNVTLIPADTTKPTINKKGHFSLIRK